MLCCSDYTVSLVQNFLSFNTDEEDESDEEDIAEDISDDSEEGIAETVEDTASGSRDIEETIELPNARGVIDNSAAVIHGTVTDKVHQQFKMCCIVL